VCLSFDGYRAFPSIGQQGSGCSQRQGKALGAASVATAPAFPVGSRFGFSHQLLRPAVGIGDRLFHRLVSQSDSAGELVALALRPLRPLDGISCLGGRPFDGLAIALSTTLEALDGNHHRRQELVDLVAVVTPYPAAEARLAEIVQSEAHKKILRPEGPGALVWPNGTRVLQITV
jgi:hypothetical protein